MALTTENDWQSRCRRADSSEEKIDLLLEWLTERHLKYDGGYPLDYRWFGKHLAIADLDDRKDRNATRLVSFTRSDLLKWWKAAVSFQKDNDDMRFDECLFETER